MEWFETIINGVLFVTVIGGLIFERKWTKQINKRLDLHKTHIDAANRAASDAKVNSLDAKRDAKKALAALEPTQVVVGGKLLDTPHNKDLVEKLRQAAARVSAKRAHPAGTGRVSAIRRSAVTNRYVAPPSPDFGMFGVAGLVAATSVDTSSHSSYSDSSSSSSSSSYDSGSSSTSSSSDSGSFGGGDSGSF